MNWLIVLEILGGAAAIAGSYKMSLSGKNEGREHLYSAFILFGLSNLFLFAFFLLEGKIPMVIQMLIFGVTALIGIVKTADYENCKFAKDKIEMRDRLIIFSLLYLCIVVSLALMLNAFNDTDFNIVPIDLTASIIAVIGSFLLSSHNYIVRSWAFVLFFIADVIFVYIGYTNQFYFFMLQSAFFIYTSSKGFYNTALKDRKKEKVEIYA